MRIQFDITKESFAAEYFEKNFLLRRNALRNAEFSMADIDQLLHTTEPTNPMLRLHKDGFVPEEQYVEVYNDLGSPRRRIIRNNFYGLLKNGATLILNRVDARQPLIRALCLEVAQFMSQHTLANGYLAFGNQASFGKHWDCHDVFAVQLHGRKRWQLFAPTMDLPLPSQTSRDVKSECPAEPVLDIILEKGDVLYIPRGWWHCATPIGEETFHAAIGVHPPYVVDYVTWLCSNKLPAYLSCRHSLSFHRDNQGLLEDAVRDLVAAVDNDSNLAEYMTLIGQSDRVPSPFNLRQGVSGAEPPLQASTEVRLNTVYPRRVLPSQPLVINGCAVALSEREETVLNVLADGRGASLAQLERHCGATQAEVRAVLLGLLAKDLVQLIPAAD